MTTTISLVPIQALSTTTGDNIQMSGPYILVRATTVAQQVQATRQLSKKPDPSTLSKEPEALRCKRRTDSNGLHHILPRPPPAAVARRNERERNRVKMVNMGFETLREHVPSGKKNKKMSKVDTLKAAVDYIKCLQDVLQPDTENAEQFSANLASIANSLQNSFNAGSLSDSSSMQYSASPSATHSSSQNSPAPSLSSDAFSESFNSEDEELPDLGSWFS